MSASPYTPQGFKERFFCALESTFDEDTKPAAAEGLNIIESAFEPEDTNSRSEEKTGSRMPSDFYKGMYKAKGNAVFYVKPQAAGTEPDCGPILEAALSDKTVVGATSVTYAHEDTETVNTLRLHRGVGNGLMESMYGAIVESLKLDVASGVQPKITAAFLGSRIARASATLCTAIEPIGESVIAVTAGTARRYEVGATVAIVDADGDVVDNNGGLGFLVTARDTAADTVTVSPVLTAATSVGDQVVAFVPTPVTGGTVAASVLQGLSLDSVDLNFIRGSLTYTPGFSLRDNEAQSDHPTGAFAGDSGMVAELEVYYRDDQVAKYGRTKWSEAFDSFTLRAGKNTAGQRMKAVAANALVESFPIKVPGSGGGASTALLRIQAKSSFSIVLD